MRFALLSVFAAAMAIGMSAGKSLQEKMDIQFFCLWQMHFLNKKTSSVKSFTNNYNLPAMKCY